MADQNPPSQSALPASKSGTRFSVFTKRPSPLDYNSLLEERKLALPQDFAEKVLEIESWIDKGTFTSEDLSELILIYSQAVEYYNSINSNKASYYADRIQMALMKPQVLDKMKQQRAAPTELESADQEIKRKREEEKHLGKDEKTQRKAQEYSRKQKERTLQINMHIENAKIEEKQELEKIIEEVHQAEDKNIDFVANDILKQSSELQLRLAERRRKAKFGAISGYTRGLPINSCKNANSKSFFRSETNFHDRAWHRNDNLEINNVSVNNISMRRNEISMIKKQVSFGEEEVEDESFNLDLLNKFADTDSSTQHKNSKITEEPVRPKLHIKTSLNSDENEDEEEEEESEDEKIEQNVIEIWKECEKVYETVLTEKEEETNKFLEDIASQKFERLALLKSDLKTKIEKIEVEEEKQKYEEEFNIKVAELENEIASIRVKGLTEIKSKFSRRKMSIVSKLDMESAKNKLKASLYGKDMSFLSTPSSQSFHLSPNDFGMYNKKQQIGSAQIRPDYSGKPIKTLVTPNGEVHKLPKTPNQITKGSFTFNFTNSEMKKPSQL